MKGRKLESTAAMEFKLKLLVLGLFIVSVSCKGEKEQEQNELITGSERTIEKQTYAEISVRKGGEWEGRKYKGGEFENVSNLELPEEHTDHSNFIRYEGPGWENSQVAYRLYVDWRNAIDIFGKKTDTLVLSQVGQDNTNSYHEEAPWGMDILKAGKSLGLGSYGRYMNDSVAHFRNVEDTRIQVSNSDGFSEVKIDYSEWTTGDETIDLASTFTIYPEDRFTKVELDPSIPLKGLTTGIVKFDDIDLTQQESEDGEWAYIATYGNQTLVSDEDKLGLAIFYKTSEVEETKEGLYNHLVIFKPDEEPVTYYFLAAWEQEPGGIETREDFEADLENKLGILRENGKLEHQ